jgi:hypothetical protein
MTQKIKLMTDYRCHPLWWVAPGKVGNIDPKTLPLSQETLSRLTAWRDTYDAILNWDDPASSGFASEEDREAFEGEGIRLWQQLRHELAPDYEVLYFSEILQKLVSDRSELEERNLIAVAE